MDLLSHFPYPEARTIQADVLRTLGEQWDRYDTFVISAPTAFGKTALSKTLMRALGSVSVLTPTNQLVEQFLEEFPDTRKLSRLDSYHCAEWDRPCSITRKKLEGFCKGCKCGSDLSVAKYRNGPGIYNYHIFLAYKLYRDVVVYDEAHNLIPIIADHFSSLIWQHDYKYPDNMQTAQQIRDWIETLPKTKRRHKKIQLLWQAVTHDVPEYQPQRATEKFNGKGTQRGHPEDRDCIKMTPVDISGLPPVFWPKGVKKKILLSATIGKKDVEALGITGRVLYINAESPIPAAQRPVILVPLVNVNRGNIDQSAATIGRYIEEVVLPQHTGEKGVIHASYQLAGLLRLHLVGDHYIFHTKENKAEMYARFRAASADTEVVLVASGMYEGIDLPQDLGRWQVIAKVPWMSLGSAAVKYQADRDPEWYAWQTIRTLIQACGRICRTPTDRGVTIVLDSTIDKLYNEWTSLLPAWYRDGLAEGRKLL